MDTEYTSVIPGPVYPEMEAGRQGQSANGTGSGTSPKTGR